MNARRIAAFVAIAVCLIGCGVTNKTVPDQLVGVWNTDAPKYEGRYFELKKDAVTFAVGDGKFTTSAVLQVKESREKTRSLYEISYMTQEGTTEKFSFYYDPSTNTIRIKSQEKMDWKRGLAGATVVQARATIPAPVAAHADALQRPPEPAPGLAKDSKMPSSGSSELALALQPGESTGPRRDPFVSLRKPPAPPTSQPAALPPGKRGILISQANLEGVAKTANGMIAVVSDRSGHTYFLYPNDAVYNGRVARITSDSIVFEETMSDPLGKPTTREIVKNLRAEK